MVVHCKTKWRELQIHFTAGWGLCRITLTVLYETVVLPTLLDSALVWSKQKETKLQNFQTFVIRNVFQTSFNLSAMADDAKLGTPLNDIVCRNESAEFFIKVH